MAFDTTNWSMVLSARDGNSSVSRQALEKLCTDYWPPLYTYLRGKGYTPELATEFTQSFFTHLLEIDFLSYINRERGKFRTFLLVSLNRFMASEYSKQTAKKRNKGIPPISIDLLQVENQYGLEPSDPKTPETIYERQWALTVMRTALENLRLDYEKAGNSVRFEALKAYITAEHTDGTYKKVAEQLGVSEGAVRVGIHRLRVKYGNAIRAIIADTVETPEEVEAEIKYLMQAVSK